MVVNMCREEQRGVQRSQEEAREVKGSFTFSNSRGRGINIFFDFSKIKGECPKTWDKVSLQNSFDGLPKGTKLMCTEYS